MKTEANYSIYSQNGHSLHFSKFEFDKWSDFVAMYDQMKSLYGSTCRIQVEFITLKPA